MCDRCLSESSNAVFGCVGCHYAICKWCFFGGRDLAERIADAERSMAEVRRAIERFQAEIDEDLYVWV